MTYSPWDPCATRTVLHSWNFIPKRYTAPQVEDILANYAPPTFTPAPAMPQRQTRIVDVIERPVIKAVVVTPKPWPYRLPGFLQPKVGTTYYAKTTTTAAPNTTDDKGYQPVRISFFQALVYGMKNPDSWKVKKVVVQDKKVQVGPPETDGLKEVVHKEEKAVEKKGLRAAEVKEVERRETGFDLVAK
jgi:hypothetical protein